MSTASYQDAVHSDPEIEDLLRRIYQLHVKDMDFRLHGSAYEQLLHRLGDPHLRLPKVIHVAVIAFAASVLQEHGYSCHIYTSPHLIDFNERIIVSGSRVSDEVLKAALKKVWGEISDLSVTFFEFTTALAFMLFAEHDADYVLLETGCGGRLDSTNIVPDPILTIITSIGYDHMHILGDTIEKIASEKAGIMKRGVPCVVSPQIYADKVFSVFKQKSQELNAKMVEAQAAPDDMTLGLSGGHQRENAGTALKALELILDNFDFSKARKGLEKAFWPGRLDCLYESNGNEVWFDAAHNAEGASVLARECQVWRSNDPEMHVIAVVGLAASKAAKAYVAELLGSVDHIYFVDNHHPHAPQTAAALYESLGLSEQEKARISVSKIETVINDIFVNNTTENARLLCCGSLYLYKPVIDAVDELRRR